MKTSLFRNGVLGMAAVGLFSTALVGSQTGALAAPNPTFAVNRVGTYGGEPSIETDHSTPFNLYEASLLAPAAFRSTDSGGSWTRGATDAFNSTGDDCLATNQINELFLCNLSILGPANAPLQGDVYKSVDHGDHWSHGTGVTTGTGTTCAQQSTTCNEFGVDRDWTDAYIPAGGSATNGEVVIMYHDFYGPSHIWVNISNDDAATFGGAEDVLTHLVPSASAALSIADTACSTVPSAVKIAKGGPHPGRVYVAWIAADPTSAGTGCNLSQAQAFHNLIVAWADPTTPGGSLPATPMWNAQLAFDAGPTHDSSTPFVGFTLDRQGNPYFGFDVNQGWDPTCAVATNPQTATCEYDMYVVWSADGGTTWGTGGGLIPGSAASALKVNVDTGTHWFPAIAAGDPGQVDVAYLETSHIIATDPNGKQHPGGCVPTPCSPGDLWYLWGAQSTDLLKIDGTPNPSPSWGRTQITPNGSPMHQGDICNLGIACPPAASNRNLADFISETVDPLGCAHIAYADDKTTNEVDSANQTSTCFALLSAGVPEAPWTFLFIPAGALATVGLGWQARRRRKAPAVG
jgi:hypothetical protein